MKTHKFTFIRLFPLRQRWKLIFWLTLALFLTFSVTPRGYAQVLETAGTSSETVEPQVPYKKKFIISSYYTPLPNQTRYVTGTFEGDVRLNGEGVHSADGTLVYPGMAAAPKNIPFGTKMLIPGFGTVAIHDRGGAIKNNRLDIWVGEGEEGLRRALGWGMRTLEVTVYGIDPNIIEVVDFAPIPLARLEIIPQRTKYFKSDIALGDSGEEVIELQRFLKKLGLMEGKSDAPGYFGDETQEAVKKFQLEEKVVDSETDPGLGNFGPKSRYALEARLEKLEQESVKKIPPPALRKGNSGENVKSLQSVLADYGFLKKDFINGKFDSNTYEALFRFQIDAGVVADAKDIGAGYYGPKTKTAIEKIVKDSFTPLTDLIVSARSSQSEENTQVFTKQLALSDRGLQVVALQEELYRLHFFGLEPTGYFGKVTEHAVFKFQQAFSIVADENSQGAGVVGPKTQEKLNEFIALRVSQRKLVEKTTQTKLLVDARVQDEKTLVAAVAVQEAGALFPSNAEYGNRGADVARLQKVLKRLGFFKGRLTTEYFGDITKQSLVTFQKSHGLQESGSFDENTRRVMNKIVAGV